ncbi:MAG: hypothetical protein KGH64_05475 [Candidatus Micrarchaeota archaeon]|nr:hypothetical protein [Candidatus Micrarchaeota archaeon]
MTKDMKWAARELLRALESDELDEAKAREAVARAKDMLAQIAILWAQKDSIGRASKRKRNKGKVGA